MKSELSDPNSQVYLGIKSHITGDCPDNRSQLITSPNNNESRLKKEPNNG